MHGGSPHRPGSPYSSLMNGTTLYVTQLTWFIFRRKRSGPPTADSLAQMLIQALHSQDNTLLEVWYCKTFHGIIILHSWLLKCYNRKDPLRSTGWRQSRGLGWCHFRVAVCFARLTESCACVTGVSVTTLQSLEFTISLPLEDTLIGLCLKPKCL